MLNHGALSIGHLFVACAWVYMIVLDVLSNWTVPFFSLLNFVCHKWKFTLLFVPLITQQDEIGQFSLK